MLLHLCVGYESNWVSLAPLDSSSTDTIYKCEQVSCKGGGGGCANIIRHRSSLCHQFAKIFPAAQIVGRPPRPLPLKKSLERHSTECTD